jgi:hypothetical protein
MTALALLTYSNLIFLKCKYLVVTRKPQFLLCLSYEIALLEE